MYHKFIHLLDNLVNTERLLYISIGMAADSQLREIIFRGYEYCGYGAGFRVTLYTTADFQPVAGGAD